MVLVAAAAAVDDARPSAHVVSADVQSGIGEGKAQEAMSFDEAIGVVSYTSPNGSLAGEITGIGSESVLDNNIDDGESENCRDKSLEDYVYQLLVAVGEDPKRTGLLKTPMRVAKSMRYLLEGYSVSAESVISGAVFHTDWGSEPIVVHLEVFPTGMEMNALYPEAVRLAIAYIPGSGRVLGLSKLARVADVLSRQLTDKDGVAYATANALYTSASLRPKGVAVSIESEKSGFRYGKMQSGKRVVLGHFPNLEDLEILFQKTHSFSTTTQSNADKNRWEEYVPGEGSESLREITNKMLRCVIGCGVDDDLINSAAYGLACRFCRVKYCTQFSTSRVDDECRKLLEPIFVRSRDHSMPVARQLQIFYIKPIRLSSTCEHHLLPFDGCISAALSLPPELDQNEYRRPLESAFRFIVDSLSGKLQLQESLTNSICERMYGVLEGESYGVLVYASASHCCMSARGIKQAGSRTNTVSSRGVFSEDKTLRKTALAEVNDLILSRSEGM